MALSSTLHATIQETTVDDFIIDKAILRVNINYRAHRRNNQGTKVLSILYVCISGKLTHWSRSLISRFSPELIFHLFLLLCLWLIVLQNIVIEVNSTQLSGLVWSDLVSP